VHPCVPAPDVGLSVQPGGTGSTWQETQYWCNGKEAQIKEVDEYVLGEDITECKINT